MICKSKVQPSMAGPSAQGLKRRIKSRFQLGYMLIWSLGFLQVCGYRRIPFLAVIGPRSLSPCWLSARGCSKFVEAILISCICPSSSSKPAIENLPQMELLSHTKSLFRKSSILFKGLCKKTRPPRTILLS